MSTYRVFLGAPSLSEIRNDPSSYSWRTFTPTRDTSHRTLSRKSTVFQEPIVGNRILDASQPEGPEGDLTSGLSVIFPPHVIEAAGERISMIYKDITFWGGHEDEEQLKESLVEIEGNPSDREFPLTAKEEEGKDTNASQDVGTVYLVEDDSHQEAVSVFRGAADPEQQTTLLTWPPSAEGSNETQQASRSRAQLHHSLDAPSFLPAQWADTAQSFRKIQQDFQTQTQPESQSFGVHSSTSSIAHFPSFYFSLHAVTPLSSLSAQVTDPDHKGKLTRKVNLALVVLEIEGPDTIRIKNGPEAGKEVSLLKLILGDEEGSVCKLTAWREIAEDWGGYGQAIGTKRGDVVYLENVMATCEPTTSISISASSYLKSSLTLCYRTLPNSPEDGRFRPDLRLGISEPCVRKVANIVHWFERTAGLAGYIYCS